MKQRATTRVWLAILTIGVAACCSNPDPCHVAKIPPKQFAGFSPEMEAKIRGYEEDFADDMKKDERKASNACCKTFTTIVESDHCHDKVQAYCEAHCETEEAKAACKNGNQDHQRLMERCLQDVYDEYVEYAPTCSRMHLGTDAFETTWTFGDGKTDRCPATGAAVSQVDRR